MTEAAKGRGRKAETPPDEATKDDADATLADSYGDQQRERVLALDPPPDDADLYERIAWILGNIPDVPKLGHAVVTMKSGGSYSYDYVREPEMMNAIRPLLARAKVAAFPSADSEGGDSVKTTMTMTFVYREQREPIHLTVAGSDKGGDRALVKSLTTGMRYLLQKQFQISTDGIDPERENDSSTRGTPRGERPPRRRTTMKRDAPATEADRASVWASVDETGVYRERVGAILAFSSGSRVQDVDGLKTQAQVDWAIGRIKSYAEDPETAEQLMAEAGFAVEPEVPTGVEGTAANLFSGDDDIPF